MFLAPCFRSILCSLSALAALFLCPNALAQSCTFAPPGLVSWWRAEGDASDFVGGNNGTLIGDASFGPGMVGQAFVFDGFGDAVDLGNPDNLKLQNFTIEAWIRRGDPTDSSGDPFDGAIILGAAWGGYGFAMSDNGRLLLSRIGYSAVYGTAAISDTNTFHHVAVTKSGSDVILYLDGVGESVGPYNPGFVFGGTFSIGARGDDHASSLIGAIDEASVYSRPLTPAEIQTLYTAGTAGKCTVFPPSINTAPPSRSVPIGQSTTFTVTSSGTAPLSYQWYFTGNTVNGATDSAFTIPSVQFSDAGDYFVVVTNDYGAATSSVATLTVVPTNVCAAPPAGLVGWWRGESNALDQVGTNNGNLTTGAGFAPAEVGQGFLFAGANAGVNLGAAANLRFQDFTIEAWLQRSSATQASVDPGGGEIFGFGSAGYCLGLLDDGGLFLTRVDIDNVTMPNAVTDTALHHVAVTKSGTNVVFYVDGTPWNAPPYQTTYTFNTPAAIGMRGDSARDSFIGTIDEVSVYNRALAANEIGTIAIAGTAGKCTGPTPPIITRPPQDQIVRAGTNALFTVLAAGSSPISFQWQFHGTNVAGATNYILTIPNAQFAAAGTYQVIVTNAYGAVTSAPANLVLQSPPIINNQPQAIAVPAGSNAVFVVGVSGSPPLSFQWQRNGSTLPGATSYSLTITNVQSINTGIYAVTITNNFGSATSATAALTLLVPVSITNQPVSQTMPAGANPFFIAGVDGSGPIRFQWRFGATKIPGATNATLSLNNVQSTNAGNYSVLVSNDFSSVTSVVAALSITNPTCAHPATGLIGSWSAEGNAVDLVSGAAATLVGNAAFGAGKVGQAFLFDGTGDAVLLGNPVALRLQDFSIVTWVKRSSVTKASSGLGGAELFSYGFGGYGLGMLDDGRPFLTQVGINNVMAGFQITDTNWHHLALTKGSSNVVFYLDGVGSPAPAYTATFSFNNNVAIGARGDNFSASFLGSLDEVDFYNRPLSASEAQAAYFSTYIGKCPVPLTWTSQPANQTVGLGGTAGLSAAVSGSQPVSWQWFLNGAPLPRATNSSLALSNINYFQAGAYNVSASNPSGSISSSNALLTIVPPTLFDNGSFEARDLSGWILTDIANPLTPIAVRPAGYNSGFGFFSTTPTDGSYCLTHGFDGAGPGRIRAAFDITLPPAPVTLTFDYRLGWDMANYGGSTKPRQFVVTIEPFGGGVGLATNLILTASPGTANYDTGPLSGSVDLSGFAGRSIRVSFDAIIPESFTGPGFFQLDNIRLTYPPVPPLLVSRSGNNAILSWPALFGNYVVQQTTNLASPINWTSLPTNAIVRGATNTSLVVPANTPRSFYRLRSP